MNTLQIPFLGKKPAITGKIYLERNEALRKLLYFLYFNATEFSQQLSVRKESRIFAHLEKNWDQQSRKKKCCEQCYSTYCVILCFENYRKLPSHSWYIRGLNFIRFVWKKYREKQKTQWICCEKESEYNLGSSVVLIPQNS